MMDNPDLGEQAISKAAEMGMRSQLDEVEALETDIRTDPIKLMQGELDSVDIKGKGLVMQKDLRTEELDVHTGNISVNPFKAAFGDIELERPTNADAHMVLTEQDIERAFNSQYIQDKLQNIQVNMDGQPMTVNAGNIEFRLPQAGQVALSADVKVVESGETRPVAFTAKPTVGAGGHQVVLEDVQYQEGKEASPELTQALLDSASELLNLRNFELQGMSLQLKQLDIQPGRLTLEAKAQVRKFPGS